MPVVPEDPDLAFNEQLITESKSPSVYLAKSLVQKNASMPYVHTLALRPFLSSLRRYIKDIERFAAAKPTKEIARTAANQALADTLASLQDPRLRAELDRLISENHAKAVQLIQENPDLGAALFKTPVGQAEMAMSSNIGLSRHKVKVLYKKIQTADDVTEELTVETITSNLSLLHQELLTQFDDTRALPKKEKRKRKKDLLAAGASASFGVGIIVMNLVLPQTFWVSLAAGMAPLGTALRDVIGTKQ